MRTDGDLRHLIWRWRILTHVTGDRTDTPQVVEVGGLVVDLDLSVASARSGSSVAPVWMLSYSGNCRNATMPGQPRAVPHSCVKVAIISGGQ